MSLNWVNYRRWRRLRRNPKTQLRMNPAVRQERELRDAVDRVLRNYGTLNAFYRDAHKESANGDNSRRD